ncbi:hypothetical protein BC826DRAFT_907192, partial [Russula brevipes]
PFFFTVVAPIHVDRFASLLDSHPNRPFVDSAIRGLHGGFWPSADDDPELCPLSREIPEPAHFHRHSLLLPSHFSSVPLFILSKRNHGKSCGACLITLLAISHLIHILREKMFNDFDTAHHLGHHLLHVRATERPPSWPPVGL